MTRDDDTLGNLREKACDDRADLLRLAYELRRARGEKRLFLDADHQSVIGHRRVQLALQAVLFDVIVKLLLHIFQGFRLLDVGAVALVLRRHAFGMAALARPHLTEEGRAARIESCRERLRHLRHLGRVRGRHGVEGDERGKEQRHEIGVGQQPSLARFFFMRCMPLFSRHALRLLLQ